MTERVLVGGQVRRWRLQRGLTLARLATASGLNVGYLSQIENDKASPSLETLGTLATALDVPAAWFLMQETPVPTVVRANERPVTSVAGGRMEHVDGRSSRDVRIIEVVAPPGGSIEAHAHPGDEHHLVLSGRFVATQGPHSVELGPGDYLRWDGSIPHEGRTVGDEPVHVLIVRVHPQGASTDHRIRTATSGASQPSAGPR